MNKITIALLTAMALPSSLQTSRAGSATWNLNPSSGSWNIIRNWTPATVPNGPSDIATFDASSQKDVATSADTAVSEIIFNSGAGAFSITAYGPLTISGAGVTNNSGITQNFVSPPEWEHIIFRGSATAGESTVFTIEAPDYVGGIGSEMFFYDDSTAGNAIIIDEGSSQARSLGGYTMFFNNSSAGNATIVNEAGTIIGGPGKTDFYDNASAGNATFTNNGATIRFFGNSTAADASFTNSGEDGAYRTEFTFFDSSSAGNALIVSNAGQISSDLGARVEFDASSSAENATLIANGGLGEGGHIDFYGQSSGGTARVALFDNGYLDVRGHDAPGVTIGSLEGNGTVYLGAENLSIGSNGRSTIFSGSILGARSPLTKVGPGKLILRNAKVEVGDLTIIDGALVVNNRPGEGTAIGRSKVNGGTLGGSGTISGRAIIGKATGFGAKLQPSISNTVATMFTIQQTVSFRAGGSYAPRLFAGEVAADAVVANGVMIEAGARFAMTLVGHDSIAAGTVFTVINNTAATAIAGTFSNLVDGATVIVGNNTFQADYEGGDGNDLMLTVQ